MFYETYFLIHQKKSKSNQNIRLQNALLKLFMNCKIFFLISKMVCNEFVQYKIKTKLS